MSTSTDIGRKSVEWPAIRTGDGIATMLAVGDGLFDEDDEIDAGFVPDAPDRLWRHPAERGAELAAANMAGRRVIGRRWPAMVVSFVAGATLVGTMWLFSEPNDRPIDSIETREVTRPEPAVLGPLRFEDVELAWTEDNRESVVGLYLVGPGIDTTTQAFLYRSDGHLITSAHAIAGAEEITAILTDGQQLPAKIVAVDSVSGVAVLKVNTPEVAPAGLFYGIVNVQDTLVAIANSTDDEVVLRAVDLLNQDQVTTMVNADLLSGLLRLTNDLESGWAGSPIVNEHGGVVGMAVTSVEGTNFAIPAQRLQRIADDLIEKQFTEHKPWIGVHLAAGVTETLREERGIRGGALITRVFPNTPADQGGLASGDVIISINGMGVNSKEDLSQALRAGKPGDEVALRYSRLISPNGLQNTRLETNTFTPEILRTTVVLGAQPAV